MKIIIKSKEIKVSQDLDSYIEKRIGKLKKFLEDIDPNLIQATVEIGKVSGRHKQGEIFQLRTNLKIPGKFFRFESRGENLYSLADSAKDEIEAEIQKYKTKRVTLFKRGARSFKKSFGISPMARFKKRN